MPAAFISSETGTFQMALDPSGRLFVGEYGAKVAVIDPPFNNSSTAAFNTGFLLLIVSFVAYGYKPRICVASATRSIATQ